VTALVGETHPTVATDAVHHMIRRKFVMARYSSYCLGKAADLMA